MRWLIVPLLLVAASVEAATDKDLETTFGEDAAWVARLHRAVAWNSGQDSVTADGIVADLKARLEHLIRFEEERHGIDPNTGADTPAKWLAQLQAERAALTAARAESAARQTALVAAVVEIDSLKAELEATKPGIGAENAVSGPQVVR